MYKQKFKYSTVPNNSIIAAGNDRNSSSTVISSPPTCRQWRKRLQELNPLNHPQVVQYFNYD